MSSLRILPFQPQLPQVLPTIEGNVDYRQFRDQLLQIDHLLIHSGLETQLIEADLQQWAFQRPDGVTPKAQINRQLHSRRALRCNIARILLRAHYRDFAARVADSPLLQHFCTLSRVDGIQVPGKSTLQRYDQWWPEDQVRELTCRLLGDAATAPEALELPEPVDLETAFLDTTCLAVNIHYPVDWVLLRDATRTLMKAVSLIRDQGLKHRMEPPEQFISRINTLCIQMTHAWHKDDGLRQRKKTLRQMDRLVGTVRNHAQRYRDLLDQNWRQRGRLHTHSSGRMGFSWESFCLEHLILEAGLPEEDCFHYTVQSGAELDLVAIFAGKRIGFEFKHADTPQITRSMRDAAEDLAIHHLFVVYPGPDTFLLDEGGRFTALAWKDLATLRMRCQ